MWLKEQNLSNNLDIYNVTGTAKIKVTYVVIIIKDMEGNLYSVTLRIDSSFTYDTTMGDSFEDDIT